MITHKKKIIQPMLVFSILAVLLFLALLCFFSARWFVSVYGRIGFDSILYTLKSSLGGVQSGLIGSYLLRALLPALLLELGAGFLLLSLFSRWVKIRKSILLLVLLVSCGLLGFAAWDVELDDYIRYQLNSTDLYEKYYQDPADSSIIFPEEKRNLVYIMLESMETSYYSQELGGAMEENLIPELYELAENNLNFSQNQSVGGFHCINGATWTVGSMVAQTAGIPLKTPTEDVNQYGAAGEAFLPGVTSLTDILHEAGYHQTLMVGSDAAFGGRKPYFLQHGMDKIYDIYTARADGIIPRDYFVWWGMEDLYLYEYAKKELTEIAAGEEPFAFTMLTVDTHHIGGYQCRLCETSTDTEPYDLSISCASRQLNEFVRWLQAQSFYEDTTIIIVGDHESMDNGYFQRNVDDDYPRMLYNCIINAPVETSHDKNRQFCAVDLFPTTLTALGCMLDDPRLGLGTDLFSGQPTLIELMGIERFNNEVSAASDYYAENFYAAAESSADSFG